MPQMVPVSGKAISATKENVIIHHNICETGIFHGNELSTVCNP